MKDSHGLFKKENKVHGPSLVNWQLISYVLGVLMLVEAGLFGICAGVSLCYGEPEYIYFIYTLLINVGIGSLMVLYGKNNKNQVNRRDGYIIVSVTWILFTTFGMLPFYISGHIPSITDAFFETMSGFTTTGATILDHIEALPNGMLFWRSFTQWLGGLGIVIFTIAFLPIFTGSNQQLFLSESTGVSCNKFQPRITVMARYLWFVYITLTFVETILLMLGGMNVLDAVCHAFSTTATGGFSTKQASVSFYNSAYIEYVIAIFMIISGINFSLYYWAVRGKWNQLWKDEEMHWFLKSVGILTLIITVALYFNNGYDWELAFRKSLFQVATVHTSCGFATDDYNLWPQFTWLLLVFAMVAGGSTGSTSGGVKSMRILIMFKNIRNQFKQILHPRAVLPVRINKVAVPEQTTNVVFTFFVTYLISIIIGWILLLALGVGFAESLGTVVSAIGNVGPGLGSFGPAYSWAALPDAAKWILSALMLLGRLEIFGILLIFSKKFWKEY